MANKYYKITSNSINVYSQKAYSISNVVGHLRKGAIVECKKESALWAKVVEVKTPSPEFAYGKIKDMYITTRIGVEETLNVNTEATKDKDKDNKEETEEVAQENYIDDAFMTMYSGYTSDEAYLSNLNSGLRVSTLNGIMGMPHQFLPNTDPKIDGSNDIDSFGRLYAEKIVAPMPLMFMTPGVPSFMTSFSKDQKSNMLQQLTGFGIGEDTFDSLTSETSGKYYSLKYQYVEYFKYVNAMLRSAAYFLGLNEKINGKSITSLNWFYHPLNEGADVFDNNGLRSALGTYAGAIPFYVEAETRISDSFSNQTAQSTLSSMTDSLSDKARELNFLIGNVAAGAGAGDLFDDLMSVGADAIEATTDTINNLLGKGNILSNLLGKAQTLLSGGRMLFPEIWSDSTFSRQYNVSMKLVSPSGDKLSIFLNILVPIYHLLAFVLPRQATASKQAYFSPFLVRAYYKGLFNIDMGIIVDMDISKGSEGEWTPDGLPTVAEVSFTIKDLYDGLFMSPTDFNKDISIMSNVTELDYIANSCGINIDEPEIARTAKMYLTLGFTDNFSDKFTLDIFGGMSQFFNQKIQNIFGRF